MLADFSVVESNWKAVKKAVSISRGPYKSVSLENRYIGLHLSLLIAERRLWGSWIISFLSDVLRSDLWRYCISCLALLWFALIARIWNLSLCLRALDLLVWDWRFLMMNLMFSWSHCCRVIAPHQLTYCELLNIRHPLKQLCHLRLLRKSAHRVFSLWISGEVNLTDILAGASINFKFKFLWLIWILTADSFFLLLNKFFHSVLKRSYFVCHIKNSLIMYDLKIFHLQHCLEDASEIAIFSCIQHLQFFLLLLWVEV